MKRKKLTEMTDEEFNTATFRLTPKAVILMALGGYNEDNMKKSQAVVDALSEFMSKHNKGILPQEGKITFIDFEYK